MLQQIQQFITAHRLLRPEDHYIVALSGGADSVALLLTLKSLGYHIEAAHCNFHLRGEESNRDEQFVVGLCDTQSIPLHRIHFDTQTYASLHKVSIEMAARELRYHYFEQLRNDIEADDICVAHHRDDSVETMLINLIRGTGIHGLTGIQPRQGHIVRPLLCVSRKQIEAYLQKLGQAFVTDSTNLVDDVVRNKIRLNVLPMLQQINPSIAESLQSTAERLAEAERIYDSAIHPMKALAMKDNRLSINELNKFPSPESLLFEWLRNYDFSAATIQQIYAHLNAETGRIWSSPTHELILNRGYIIVEPKTDMLKPMRIPEPGNYVIGSDATLRISLTTDITVVRTKDFACLDAALVDFPLTVRPVQEGDRFVPFGMKGSRLVSDFLTDLKLSLFERRRQLVVASASGDIVWIVGLRPDQRYCIQESTRQMLICQYTQQKQGIDLLRQIPQ